MSASLVGSEMCIRDSYYYDVNPEFFLHALDFECYKPGIFRRIQDDAVSYTHLTLPTICSV
eukprot:7456122-Alexandrium_andersonii.AAC.1